MPPTTTARDSMTRPWLKHYPAGVEPEIPPPAHRHLPEMLRDAMRKYADSIAFTQCMPNGMNASLTFAETDLHSDAFAAWLRESAGLQQGDRVAVQMPNCLAYPVVAMGILKAGCVLVNTNPLYTPPEMTHQFADAGARVVVIIDLFADRLTSVMPKTKVEKVVTVRITEFFPALQSAIVRIVQKYIHKTIPKIDVPHIEFRAALAEGHARLDRSKLDGYLAGIGPESLAALQYTGGTTGVAKGAMLSHGNLLSNTSQMITMAGPHIREHDECVLTALPLYHIFAFTVNLLAFFQKGGRNVLIPSPRPPKNLKPAFEKFPITWFTGVNTLFNALTHEDWFSASPPKTLRVSAAGGMALHPAVAERWRKITGTAIVEGYGLTESSPVLTFNPIGVPNRDGSIGIPIPSTDIRCVDPDTGNPVPDGEPGELIARGPQIMLGYWQRPDETAKSLKDGWLYTGDIARMDQDGYFWIVDRKKDMILVSGFNVYPNEVEEVLAKHPKIKEAGVIGVPDDKTGEAVKAFVVAKEPVTEQEIIAFCKQSLAAYKVPRHVEFRDELPKSPIGKIIRKDLRTPPASQ